MFKNVDHFKKATQSVYNTFKSRPNLKLSEFRQVLLADAGFKNIQSYAASFKDKPESLPVASNENNAQESSEKINIVSVIIQVAGIITEKTDYLDTVKGNIQAEESFRNRILNSFSLNDEHPPFKNEKEMEEFFEVSLDNGYEEVGNITISLIHSTD